ncbi:MarR family winged helix-turn-helix transcriptional regulator [Microbacterium sp. CFBP9034]|uniref:MarR family winged helix-turn-helix transcriptional regulator n=1 Tax=Microbacterium sp. CFBP9034 TaxID=3096540 RepID=UPI002A6B4C65|nr:MarR family transcriptional regulator [Microbacterium sp. CFBP9034]MDY0908537.1 MarR family transcriptional regulator [Microbacterium sp. CFBP9034]
MIGHDDAAVGARSDDELLENIGTAFSRMRRRTSSVPIDLPAARTDVRRDLLLAIVEESDGLLSVNAVASAMGMERTAVSRLAASCVTEGLVERVASQSDGRSITLRITPDGREVLAGSRQQQRRAFEYITRDWDDDERLEFARLLHKYVAATSPGASD